MINAACPVLSWRNQDKHCALTFVIILILTPCRPQAKGVQQYTDMCTHAHKHADTHTHIHTHTHACAATHAHTHFKFTVSLTQIHAVYAYCICCYFHACIDDMQNTQICEAAEIVKHILPSVQIKALLHCRRVVVPTVSRPAKPWNCVKPYT